MKHLNPRQGITTERRRLLFQHAARRACETPKSPPGDYNTYNLTDGRPEASRISVKHLNPRQGITTEGVAMTTRFAHLGVKHLNPRQGITTFTNGPVWKDGVSGVKHLNPRQGITTLLRLLRGAPVLDFGVKHLNPRQGITTAV